MKRCGSRAATALPISLSLAFASKESRLPGRFIVGRHQMLRVRSEYERAVDTCTEAGHGAKAGSHAEPGSEADRLARQRRPRPPTHITSPASFRASFTSH